MGFQIPDPPMEASHADMAAYIQGLARQLADETPENASMTSLDALFCMETIVVAAATMAGTVCEISPARWLIDIATKLAMFELIELTLPSEDS